MRALLSHVFGVPGRFGALRDFISEMEPQITRVIREHAEFAASAEMEEIREPLLNRISHMQEHFPRDLRYGAIVAVYTAAEQTLTRACNYVQESRHERLSVHKSDGEDLERHTTYLERVLGLKAPLRGLAAYQPVRDVQTLRHAIAHVHGHVPSMKGTKKLPDGRLQPSRRLREVIERRGATVDADDYLSIPHKALRPLIDGTESWLNQVLEEVGAGLGMKFERRRTVLPLSASASEAAARFRARRSADPDAARRAKKR